jgi:PAS domain S-box-containing protein
MLDSDKSKEQLIEELASLRQEIAQLQSIKKAFEIQQELTKSVLTLERTAKGTLMLKSTLIEIVKMSNELTEAEESSIFLLDGEGNVTESILARGATIKEKKQVLIESVLDRGLAGWVFRERKMGLITDTIKDDRWLTLPGQPYQVRSVLCVPIFKGKTLLALVTLMHSEPEHFTREKCQLMENISTNLSLIVDHVLLYSGEERREEKPEPKFSAENDAEELKDSSLEVGIFIIDEHQNFLYANRRLAEIFGYEFGELVSLESISSLVVTGQHEFFIEQVNQCFDLQRRELSGIFPGQRKDGRTLNIEIYGNRTKFYNQTVIIGVVKPVNYH